VFVLIFMNLCVAMWPKIMKNSNNLFQKLFSMHPNSVLCKFMLLDIYIDVSIGKYYCVHNLELLC
jgi:hypothetical protein